ncbi:MAG: hypothetical protein ACJ76X_16005 [Solirubrobacteraceae bacterium]|jgi:hypothetical protein
MTVPLRLIVEVDPELEPIRGTVTGPDGRARVYLGWLALIDALEDWRRQTPAEEKTWPVSPSS